LKRIKKGSSGAKYTNPTTGPAWMDCKSTYGMLQSEPFRIKDDSKPDLK